MTIPEEKCAQSPDEVFTVFVTFIDDCRLRNLSAKTISFYEQQVRPFLEWCLAEGVTEVSDITKEMVRAYLRLRRRGRSVATVRAAYRAIRSFLNFCLREGLIASSPMASIGSIRADERILPALSDLDVQKLLDGCDTERDRAILHVLLQTGMRAGELIRLKGGDVDMLSGTIHVRLGKGARDRLAYLQLSGLVALKRYYDVRGTPGVGELIWLSETAGTPLTQAGLYQLLKRLGHRLGVLNTNPHAFRRTFAVACLRNGMSENFLARLMGHRDTSILRQYLPLADTDLRQAYRQYGPKL